MTRADLRRKRQQRGEKERFEDHFRIEDKSKELGIGCGAGRERPGSQTALRPGASPQEAGEALP